MKGDVGIAAQPIRERDDALVVIAARVASDDHDVEPVALQWCCVGRQRLLDRDRHRARLGYVGKQRIAREDIGAAHWSEAGEVSNVGVERAG